MKQQCQKSQNFASLSHPRSEVRKRVLRRARSFRFSQLLVLVLCYCILIQPNAALATQPRLISSTPLASKQTPVKTNEVAVVAETAASSTGLTPPTFLDKLRNFFGGAATEPLPVVVITDAAVSRNRPTLNAGRIEGSLRVFSGETFVIKAPVQLTGDLYTLGTPQIIVNSGASHGGTINDGGSATPSNYSITLNGGLVLPGKIHIHADALTLPADIPASVPAPAGTRTVNINLPGDVASIGNWSTLKDLNVTPANLVINVPPGNYNSFNLTSASRLNFTAGTYNFAGSINLNGGGSIQTTGRVDINIAQAFNLNQGSIVPGAATLPGDVHVNAISTGGCSVNGNSQVTGLIRCPNSTFTLNGTYPIVTGQVIAKFLNINAGKITGNTSITPPPDTTAPTISITSPANNSPTTSTTISINGTAADSGTGASGIAQVTVNNAAATYTAATGTWTFANLTLSMGPNTIIVRATDIAGNASAPQSIVVIRQNPPDTAAPTVSISSPSDNSTTPEERITVSGSASDAGVNASGVAQVTVNGVAATFSQATGNWTISNLSLSTGNNPIVARATDTAGNVSMPQTIHVTRQDLSDTTPPTVAIESPANNSTTQADSIMVSGKAADVGVNSSGVAQVTVNGVPATFNSANGTWAISNVSLARTGNNPIVARATDTAGNVSTPHTINVIREEPSDTTLPTVDITFPANNSTTPAETTSVSGNASDVGANASGVAKVTVNGLTATLNATAGTWTISNVPLPTIGTNSIVARATDRAGNLSEPQSISVIRAQPADTQAPTVTITSPANDFVTPEATITVTGTAIDEGAYGTGVRRVLVNGQQAAYDPATHQWTATGVLLNEGSNPIRVFADDNSPAANHAEIEINVTRHTPDTTKPAVTIISPLTFETYEATLSVVMTAVDEGLNATGVQQVTVNGVPASHNPENNQWSVTGLPLVYGGNPIVVIATDGATTPNQGTAEVNVMRLRIPPATLTISNPQNGAVLAATSITVAGSVSSLGTVTVTVNGQNAPVSGGQFAKTVSLAEGANTIAVVATDSISQQTQLSISVMRDLSPPTVSFANVPASVQPGGTYQILVDAADNVGVADVEFRLNGQHVATSTNAPYQFNLEIPLAYAAGSTLVLSAVARDLTDTTAVATAQTRTSGPGGISGYVFDDATGYVLSGVNALLNADASMVTDDQGVFTLISATPSGVVRLTKDGYTPVERLYSVSIGEGTALFDARLTPLDSQANLIGVAGGTASGDGGRLQVSFIGGTFAATTDMRVTSISPQGLANLLPYGWSPVPGAVIDLRPATSTSTASPQLFQSSAHLVISQVAGLTAATPLVLARLDETTHRWMVIGLGLVSTDAGALAADLPRAGQYAFLVADTGSTVPPVAIIGQPLTASQPADSAALDSAQASAVASPRSAVYSTSARSAISFFATASSQLPSGVSIEATFGETYNLLGGRDSVLTDRPAQDFVLYAYPAATVDQPTRLGALFIAKPTRTDFSITELFNANVHVEIRSGRQTKLGVLIDTNGGGLRAGDGSQLTIPANAVAGSLPMFFASVPRELVNVSLPPEYEVVAAFDVDLASATLNSPATISVPGITGDLSRVLVARLLTVGGQRSPKVVARAVADSGGKLISTTAAPAVPAGVVLSGIRTSGRYVFIRIPKAFGYVKGSVTDASNSTPLGMVKISDDQTPFIDVTGSDGQFVVVGIAGAAALGANQIGAAGLTTDATGKTVASLDAQDAVATVNISVSAVPLQVESITPASNAQNMIATTPVTVTFNKPISSPSLTGSSFTLSTASGNPVLGSITVMAGSRVAVFTPGATLAASTSYKVSLSQSVRDIYSRPLAADFNSTFTTAATVTVSNRLRPELIVISYPDANGTSTVSIPAGSVPEGSTILVVNNTSGSTIATVAGTQATSLLIQASVGDEIVVTIRQTDGTEYTVTQAAYRRADGFVSVGAHGGTMTSDDGVIVLSIPSGAINGQANIKLTPKGEDSITIPRTGEMDPSNVAFGAAVEIRADGDFTLLKEVHLELPAPAGAQEGKRMAFMKPSKVQFDGQDVDVWETVTSGTVVGGKFKTSSPPFFGSTFATGVFILYAMMPTFARVVFGSVKEVVFDKPSQGVPGVVCLLGDFDSNYYGRVVGRTNAFGTYALFDFSASTANAVPVKAIDVATGRRGVGIGATIGTIEDNFIQGLTGFQVLNANIVLPARGGGSGGEAPPSIILYGQSGNLPAEQDPLTSRGVVTVPQQVTITAWPNRALQQISGTVLVGGVETRQLTWREVVVESNGSRYYVTTISVSAEGSYRVKVTGTTQLGNPSSTTIVTYNFVGLRNPNTRPPLPGPPSVIHVTPADSAENVDLATDIRFEFSEPVHNLVPGLTVYAQEDGRTEKIGGTILSGGLVVQPDTTGISSIVFKPATSLPADKKYFVHVTTEVRDDTNDTLDQQYEGQADTSKQPFTSSFRTFGGMTITPQPIQESGTRIVVAGSYALTMQGNQSGRSRVNIYDIANPITPTLSGSFYVPQRAFDLTVTDSEEDSLKVDGRVHTRLAAVVTVSLLHEEQWANVWFVNLDEISAPEIVGVTSIFLPLDVPSTPISVRLHKGRAYIGNIPYQGVNVVDVAQSIKLFNQGLASGKNPVVDAVRPETAEKFAGFGQQAKVQTATLRQSQSLDTSGTAPSVAVLDQGLPVVYVANNIRTRLGVLAFSEQNDGVNIATTNTLDVPDLRILSKPTVNPADSYPSWVRAVEDVTVPGGQRVPLALLLSPIRLWIFNVANPQEPIQYPSKSLAELGLTGAARWLEVEGTLAYVALDNDVAVIDFADPANPRLVSRLTGVGSHLSGLAVKDGFIYSLSSGFDAHDGLNVSIASPASRLFIYGASANASTICGNPIILDKTTGKMKQSAGFYFQVFGHKQPGAQKIIIRKGEETIATVPATILPGSTELVTLGRAEWRTDTPIDRAANYTAELLLDESATGEYRSHREAIPFSFLLENYSESIALQIAGSTVQEDEKTSYGFVLGANANVTLTVGSTVVLSGPRSFGLHVEQLSFTGMSEGHYPFTLKADAQGDSSITEQISGVLNIQRNVEDARPPGHTIVSGVDIASGDLNLDQNDVPVIGNRGLSLSFTRSYSTSQANTFGPLGYGWKHNFQVLLTSTYTPNGITYRVNGGDGSGQSFKATSVTGNVTMQAEKPYHTTLVRKSDGSLDYYTKARIRYHFPGAYENNSFSFNEQSYMGNLEYMEDPSGNKLTLAYDQLGRMIRVSDSSNRTLRFEYIPAARPFSGVISATNATRTEQSCVPRNQLNLLRQRFVKAQVGQAWRIKSISGPGGLSVTYDYDQLDGNLIGVKRQGVDDLSAQTPNAEWKYAYKPTPTVPTAAELTHFIKSATNPNGHTTSYDYSYDQLGTPLKTVALPENVSVKFVYTLDQNNRITRANVTDGRQNATTYILTADGYTSVMTAPRGAQTTFEFNDAGLKTSEKDPLGLTTTFDYDAKGNLKKQTSTGTDGTTVSSETVYDQTFSKPLSLRDANGNLTTFTLDTRGNVTRVMLPTGRQVQMDYAANGDLSRKVDQYGFATSYQYDPYGNPTSVTRETSAQATVTMNNVYDVRSRLRTSNDTLAPAVENSYDALDRIVRQTVTDPTNIRDALTNVLTYFPEGQVKNVTRTGGSQSLHVLNTYDGLNRIVQSYETPNGAGPFTLNYGYDGNSNLLTETNRRGVTTTRTYDELNFLKTEKLSGAFGPELSAMAATEIDKVGNPVRVTNLYGQESTFDYDGLHRLTKRHLPGEFIEEIGYDKNGNITLQKDRNKRATTFSYDAINRRTGITDPAGRVTTWTHNDASRTTTTQSDPQGLTETVKTDGLGRILQRAIKFGSANYLTTSSYDGRTVRTTDARSVVSVTELSAFGEMGTMTVNGASPAYSVQMSYGPFGGLKHSVKANAREMTYTLDGLNRTTVASYTGDFSESSNYDGEGNVVSHSDVRGYVSQMTYDNMGRALTTVIQDEQPIPVSTIVYNDAANTETSTDANGHPTVVLYDGLRRPKRITNADSQPRTLEYDGMNLRKESDYKGVSTSYVYDQIDRVTQITDRLGQVTNITNSDSGGYTKSVTDRRGNQKTEVYDPLQRLLKVTDGGAPLVSYEYDANNNRTAMVDGRTNRTTYTYDELNRLTKTNHAADLQTETFKYDAVGNVLTYNDGAGADITQTYDELDHLKTRTDGENHTTQFEYDGAGLLLKQIEPKGDQYKTTYLYNALRSLKSVTDANTGTWEFGYDGVQNLISIKDALRRTMSYEYDTLNRVQTITQPQLLITSYGYDPNSNRTGVTDAKGQHTTIEYDALDRVKTMGYEQTTGAGPRRYDYGYDPEGNVTRVDETTVLRSPTQQTRSYTRNYDARDRLTAATDPYNHTVQVDYDAANNVISLTDAANKPSSYVYDPLNRLQKATLPNQASVDYTWRADGLLKKVAYPGGMRRDYDYDNADRLTAVTNHINGTESEEFAYTYDANSNRDTETRKQNGQPTRAITYDYDLLNRLNAAAYVTPGQRPANPAPGNSVSYTEGTRLTGFGYDAVGNRTTSSTQDRTSTVTLTTSPESVTTESRQNADGQRLTTTARFDELNRLTQLTSDAAGSVPTIYAYDRNGNLTSTTQNNQVTASYEYDVRDQLRRVSNGANQEVAGYDYDFERQRISKTIGGNSLTYVYGGDQVVNEYGTNNQLLNRYDVGAGEVVRGELGGEGERYYFSDGQGSVTSLAQQSQSPGASTTARYEYDAWGNYLSSSGASYNSIGYTGQRMDGETGLMPLGNGERYYSPGLGSFIQQDTFAGMAAMAQSMNRYAYANNNPLRYADPTGQISEENRGNIAQSARDYGINQNGETSSWGIAKSTLARSGYDFWNMISFGALDRQEETVAQVEHGEITTEQFEQKTRNNVLVSFAQLEVFILTAGAGSALSGAGLLTRVTGGAGLGVGGQFLNESIEMAGGFREDYSSAKSYALTGALGALFGAAMPGRAQSRVHAEGRATIASDLRALKTEVGEYSTKVGNALDNYAANSNARALRVIESGRRSELGAVGERPKTSSNAVRSSAEVHAGLPDALKGKAVATVGESQTISGWSNKPPGFSEVDPQKVLSYSQQIGHPIKLSGAMDQGVPGRYYASHAERQAALLEPGTVDVSSRMCNDCVQWWSRHAVHTKQIQRASDPTGTHLFHPDGSISKVPER